MNKHTRDLKYKLMITNVNDIKRVLSRMDRIILEKDGDVISIQKGNSYIIRQGENQTIIKNYKIDRFLKEHLNKGYARYINFEKTLKC